MLSSTGVRVLSIGGHNEPSWLQLPLANLVYVGYDQQGRDRAHKGCKNTVFYEYLSDVPRETFDHIIIGPEVIHTVDLVTLCNSIRPYCASHTRIIITWYKSIYKHIFRRIGYTYYRHWLGLNDIKNILTLNDLEPLAHPKRFFDLFKLKQCVVTQFSAQLFSADTTVSVVIPCRNEKGNIEAAVKRIPLMGLSTEIIFVEGHSSDGTGEEIQRVMALHPEKKIMYLIQKSIGKADAVRVGFAHATGEVLMILDADLTVQPEELPKFYTALCSGKGRLINGSRLVYALEPNAMRFLNLLANHGFAYLFSWLLGQRIRDTLCGTKVLYKTDYERITNNRAFFGNFDPFGDFDLLCGAAKLNLKIVDIPISYKRRHYGTSQIRRFYHGLLLLKMSFVVFKKLKLRI